MRLDPTIKKFSWRKVAGREGISYQVTSDTDGVPFGRGLESNGVVKLLQACDGDGLVAARIYGDTGREFEAPFSLARLNNAVLDGYHIENRGFLLLESTEERGWLYDFHMIVKIAGKTPAGGSDEVITALLVLVDVVFLRRDASIKARAVSMGSTYSIKHLLG